MPKIKEAEHTEDQIIKAYETKWGTDKVRKGNEYDSPKRISTGSLELDYAIGGNPDLGIGVPIGRTSRFWGTKSSGKTLNCLNVVGNAQRLGLRCAWINAEKTFTAEFAESRGVDTSELLVVDETVIEALVEFIHAELPHRDLFVIDSASNCISFTAKKEGLVTDRPMVDAKAWTNSLKYLNEAFKYNSHTFLFVDQVRMASSGRFQFSENPAGGNYIDHHVALQVKYTSSGWLYDSNGELTDNEDKKSESVSKLSDQLEPAGKVIKARVEKSKVGRPFKTATMWLRHDTTDFDTMYEYEKFGTWFNVIETSGAWYKLPGIEKKVNGKPALRRAIAEHPEIQKQIREETMRAAG